MAPALNHRELQDLGVRGLQSGGGDLYMTKRFFKACALDLPNGNGSPPTLSAVGEYDLANHIVACAKRYGVPIVERPELCDALSHLELDSEIPTELFEAAAAILAEIGALRTSG